MALIETMDNIPWELTADGRAARHAGTRPFPLQSAVALRRLAVEKMTRVALVSADFGGRPVVFAPAAAALVDSGARVDFFALYASALPGEDDPADLPAYCARRAVWVRDEDFERLGAAASKKQYLGAGPQVASRLVFLTRDGGAALGRLHEEAGSLVRRGARVEPARREDTGLHNLAFMFAHDSTRFEISYTPAASECAELERWAREWGEAFARLDFGGGRFPDAGCRISYEASLLELLATINE